MRRTKQHDRIMDYIQRHGSITPQDAFPIGITKLSTRVGEMIKDGARIKKTWVRYKDEDGYPVGYMKYSLEE